MGILKRALGSGWPGQKPVVQREVVPLEGTNMSLWNSIIPNWWAENVTGTQIYGTADLASRVWVANRCQKLNSQAIAAMPMQWNGPPGVQEPLWVSSPDVNLFPNGIGDALHTIVDQMYGWGFSCQYVTSDYADGYPRTWTVLPSQNMNIDFGEDGRRRYRLNETLLDRDRIVQIDRNPSTAAHGTSALRAYAAIAWGLLAAQNQSVSVTQGGIPQAVLKSQRKLSKEQAEALQEQWTAMVLATAYGVPGPILNMALSGGLTYQNPVALMQMWWLTELSTTSKRIMDAFSAQLLPRGQWVSQDATDMTIEGSIEAADDPQAASSSAQVTPALQPGRLQAVGGGVRA